MSRMLSSTRGFGTEAAGPARPRAVRTSARRLGWFARWGASGIVGAVLLTILVLVAAFGPLVTGNPMRMDVPNRLQPPSPGHFMGTDEFGRNILTRVVNGARISLGAGVGVVVVGLGIGLTLGVVAAYRGGGLGLGMMSLG